MQCINPVWLNDYDLWVPCGKCMPCKIARSREWATRMLHELNEQGGCFVTLTYDDAHVPHDNGLNKREMVLWIKKLRKGIEPKKIKYYLCGEYGETYGRPHYHAIIFGMEPTEETKEIIHDTWNNGFVKIGTVTYDSCRYVAEYIQKGLMSGTNLKQLGSRCRPFALMSKGIGKAYAMKNKKQLIENLEVSVHGVKTGIPRYYRKIIPEITQEMLAEKSIKANSEKLKKLKRQTHGNDEAIWPRVISGRRQTLKKIIGKRDVKKSREPGAH